LRIAQIAPLFERVPPLFYGGTERVVSILTEELVAQGHDVTLFASGDSITRARLVATTERSLRLDPDCVDARAHMVRQLEDVFRDTSLFDVLHFHIDYIHYPLSRRQRTPHLTTLHGRLNIPDLVPLYRTFPEVPVSAISNAQREPLPWLNWQGVVYHGLPEDLYDFFPGAGSYLACIGRISPEKGVDKAIEIARRAAMPLKIAAKVDEVDRGYYEARIEPLIDGRNVEFIGEIGESEKNSFLGGAAALLFPIDWPEPFGLVMIESMACGTPVIAFPRGSVPEVLDDGITGSIVDDVDGAVAAVRRIGELDRKRCRNRFLERFTASRMAGDYVRILERLAAGAPAAVNLAAGRQET
jgi:glycosyltransferase involved in cell wall biosynthesis